jgi:hypothetical protein
MASSQGKHQFLRREMAGIRWLDRSQFAGERAGERAVKGDAEANPQVEGCRAALSCFELSDPRPTNSDASAQLRLRPSSSSARLSNGGSQGHREPCRLPVAGALLIRPTPLHKCSVPTPAYLPITPTCG